MFAQTDNDDNLNGGPAQAPINEPIIIIFLLTIAVVFVYMYKKNKIVLKNSIK